jgi:hypothetical protein
MKGNAVPSREVARAVARAEGLDPTALRQRLMEVVDTDALDRLFRETTGHVRFEYHGYEVTVTADGEVSLDS